MTKLTQEQIDDGQCPAREDEIHCEHWWDGEECHSCGAPAMTREQKIEQGMIEEDDHDDACR